MRRDPLIDNAKGVLIVLVVAGHLVMTYAAQRGYIAFAHSFIYLFHMPAFAFFSGYVVTSAQRSASTAIRTLLPLYLGFSCVHLVARYFFYGELEWEIFVAPGLLWYLLSLMSWRLLLPLTERLRHPIALSIVVSLVAGLTDRFGTTLSLSRTLVFLPFFLMGVACTRDHVDRIRRSPAALAVPALVGLVAVAWSVYEFRWIRMALMGGHTPYSKIDSSVPVAMLGRLTMVCCTLAAIYVLLRALPQWQGILSTLGRYSLGIYVLHMYVIYAFDVFLPTLPHGLPEALVLISPIVIALLLCTPPARWFVRTVERTMRALLDTLVDPSRGATPVKVE